MSTKTACQAHCTRASLNDSFKLIATLVTPVTDVNMVLQLNDFLIHLWLMT